MAKRVQLTSSISITSTGANTPRRQGPADLSAVIEGATADEIRELELGAAEEVALDLTGVLAIQVQGLGATDRFALELAGGASPPTLRNMRIFSCLVDLVSRDNLGDDLAMKIKGNGEATATIQVWLVRK